MMKDRAPTKHHYEVLAGLQLVTELRSVLPLARESDTLGSAGRTKEKWRKKEG